MIHQNVEITAWIVKVAIGVMTRSTVAEYGVFCGMTPSLLILPMAVRSLCSTDMLCATSRHPGAGAEGCVKGSIVSTCTRHSNQIVMNTRPLHGLATFATACAFLLSAPEAPSQPRTYCNPLNLDYAYVNIPNFTEQGRHRATADPVIMLFQGKYYLFSTNQRGYWWSNDLLTWNFVHRTFLKPYHKTYDDLCAPAVVAAGDTLLVLGSTYTKDFPLWMSTHPTTDSWTEAVDSFGIPAWDPCLFIDTDNRMYLYHGSSNDHPIYGVELNRTTFKPIGEQHELLRLHDDEHGWERFGEHADNVFLNPFIEGAWMTKHNGFYYLQYAAPGTEFNWYGDGVYVGRHPLGPFTYQSHNPFSSKPGGFARGAGHGSTFQDKCGNWWHVSTIAISVKNNFERRLGLWPAGFDSDGILFCTTAYGDYPHYIPSMPGDVYTPLFTGWMLLNQKKPVTVSSTLGGFAANNAVDEDIKTYWSAATGDAGESLTSDLGAPMTVRAIQVNFADQNATLMGKQRGIYHAYTIAASTDGSHWTTIIDKKANRKDVPHDYCELQKPVEARFVRITNSHVPTGTFALSGFRVFGRGHGQVPDSVRYFIGLRGASEPRSAWLKWEQNDNAVGYVIYYGTSPEKLYSSIMVYGANEYSITALDKSHAYYFQIEPFNENGIGKRGTIVKV
jgi:xylan 1,4-beta-xylosidase